MHLSTAGWVILILFVLFVVSLNLNLIFALRKKHPKEDWVDRIQEANRTAANPWKKEDESFEELARKVEEIQSAKKPTNNHPSE